MPPRVLRCEARRVLAVRPGASGPALLRVVAQCLLLAAIPLSDYAWPQDAIQQPTSQAALSSHSFLTSDGVWLHVIEGGPAARPVAGQVADRRKAEARHAAAEGAGRTAPIIAFVPGWGMPARIWLAQLAAFSATHRVAALDPRGQGESELPSGGFNIERRGEDVREFVARYPRVVLVAWSLGALEALHFIHRHGAGPVEALVIVDSSVGEGYAQVPPPPGSGFADELRRDRDATVESFVRAIFRRPLPEAELLALRDGALRMPLEASLSLFPSAVPRAHWRRAVHAFRRPLLYAVTPQFAAQAVALRKGRPGTRIEVFRDAGHALFVDEPERFNRLLMNFLAANGLRR